MRVRSLLALIAVAALATLSACGGDDPDGATPEPGTTAPTTEADGPAPTGDDDEPDTTTSSAPSTTGPEAEDAAACAVVTPILVPVVLDPEDGPDEEEGRALLEDLASTMAAEGPEALRADATRLGELLPLLFEAADPDDPALEPLADELLGLVDGFIAWSGGACAVEDLVWACLVPQGFQTVGESIGGSEETEPEETGASQPEDAFTGDWEPVEADRDDDRVLYARVGPDGLVTETQLVQRTDDGWGDGGDRECIEPTGEAPRATFETVGEPIEG